MIYFASTSSDLDALNAHPDIGVMTGPCVGGLGSIRMGSRPWASDCDALSKHGFDEGRFLQHVERLIPFAARCQFLVVPDVPGCAESTLGCFHHYARLLEGCPFPLAYVLQDGAEALGLPEGCAVAFLGGSDAWRHQYGPSLIRRALGEERRVHVRRVNSAVRLRNVAALGVHSCDGTYLGFRGAERGLREIGHWLMDAQDREQPLLPSSA